MYRLLLYLYPSSFRAEYGDEMARIFHKRRAAAGGALSVLWLWISEIMDVAGNAAVIHWDILQRDLRYTLRTVRRSPGFALTAIVVTALGIGANTAVFSVVNHVLLRPMPYQDSERLLRLWEKPPSYSHNEVSPPNFRDWQRMSTSFEGMASYANISVNLVGNGTPERMDGASVNPRLLSLLGVKPVIGRLFTDEDDRSGAGGAVLISYGLWQSRFGGTPAVLGQSVRLDDEPHTVIGVLPSNFFFPDRDVRVWTTLRLRESDYEDRDNNYLKVVAKLKNNVSVDQARAEMAVIAEKLEREYPENNANTGITVDRLRDAVSTQSRLLLAALLGASGCVLLIACMNLANLFLVRAMARRKELTVRTALGAGRERLIRQLFTESLVFALAGSVAGLALADASLPLLATLVPASLPIGDATILDVRVLSFTTILLFITAIGLGVLPALRISSGDDLSGLREGSRSGIGGRKERLRVILVTAEVTASVVLLVASGLLLRALWRIQSVDPGFKSTGVLTLQTPLPMPKYEVTARRIDFYSRVLSEIRALPAVDGAAYISGLPMVMRGGIWDVEIKGRPADTGDAPTVGLRFVSPGFFQTLDIKKVAGRDVSDADTNHTPMVAVVSESFVRRFFPGEAGVGRRFTCASQERTIVGVVHDVFFRGLERKSEPQVYLPYAQVPDASLDYYAPKALVIKTSANNEAALASVRRIVQKVDPEMPLSDIRTLEDVILSETAPRRVQIRVIGAFAALSLLLAGIGIHGLLGFAVSERTPEIGLRMALGARSTDILRMVLHQGFQVIAIGGSLGLLLAYAAARAMEAMLAGIKPGDATTFLVACAIAMLTTLSGSLGSAIRALRIDPALAMRAE